MAKFSIDLRKVKKINFSPNSEHSIRLRATEGDEFADGYDDEVEREKVGNTDDAMNDPDFDPSVFQSPGKNSENEPERY